MISYRSLLTLAIVLVVPCSLFGAPVESATDYSDLTSGISLSFTSNMGQWDDTILFRTETNGLTVWFTQSGSYYQLPEIRFQHSQLSQATAKNNLTTRPPLIQASYLGATTNPVVRGSKLLSQKSNYFLGDNREKWAVNVPNYEAIIIENIYVGIDLKYYGNQSDLEYDYILAPGADPSQIRIQYIGAEAVAVDHDGSLIITTQFGELKEQPPVIYQTINKERIQVAGQYRLYDHHSFGFELPDGYDQAYKLVIDPVLGYTSYIGVSGNNEAFDVAVDQSGAVIITGYTNSADFAVTDPLQSEFGGGFYDIVVTKLSPNGQSIEFSTFLGGNGDDKGHALTVDKHSDIYLTGVTTSTDFPTLNPFQPELGGVQDLFVSKLSADGTQLEYSTYLGGADIDVGSAIEVDTAGNAYLTGHTRSTDFPNVNSFQSALGSSNFDAFVTKLTSSGATLEYSTFLGGSSSDYGRDLKIDSIGNAFIVGDTRSNDFPVKNPYQEFLKALSDLFVVKLNGFGSGLRYATYLGGTGNDHGYGIAIVNGGKAVITGFTFSTNLPIANAFQPTHGGGLRDAFVTRFGIAGSELEFSSYLGGSGEDYAFSIISNEANELFVTGATYSDNFPVVNPLVGSLEGRQQDPFLTKLITNSYTATDTIADSVVVIATDTTVIDFSSYLGGLGNEIGYALTIDNSGGIYVAGTTDQSFAAASPGEGSSSSPLLARSDMFVTKFYDVLQCCGLFTSGATGNVNCSVDGKRNLADITSLIDRVYINKNELCCEENGNVNGDPDDKINLADITRLIDHVYISKEPAANCF